MRLNTKHPSLSSLGLELSLSYTKSSIVLFWTLPLVLFKLTRDWVLVGCVFDQPPFSSSQEGMNLFVALWIFLVHIHFLIQSWSVFLGTFWIWRREPETVPMYFLNRCSFWPYVAGGKFKNWCQTKVWTPPFLSYLEDVPIEEGWREIKSRLIKLSNPFEKIPIIGAIWGKCMLSHSQLLCWHICDQVLQLSKNLFIAI